jgi:hypothetical protein
MQFSQELTLPPDVIHCRRSGCKARKELAVFLLLRRQYIAGKWEIVSKDMQQQRSWCIFIYYEIFRFLAQCYWKFMQVGRMGPTNGFSMWHRPSCSILYQWKTVEDVTPRKRTSCLIDLQLCWVQ